MSLFSVLERAGTDVDQGHELVLAMTLDEFSAAQPVSDGIRVARFMHETDEIDSVAFDLIVDVVWKRPAVFAGKAMRSDMITTFPTNDRPDSVFDPFMEIAAEPVGNGVIPGLRIQQILFEKR